MKTRFYYILILLLILAGAFIITPVTSLADTDEASDYTIQVNNVDENTDIAPTLNKALKKATKLAEQSGHIITVKVSPGNYLLSRSLHIFSNTTLDVTDVHLKYDGNRRFNLIMTGTTGSYKGQDNYNGSELCSGYDGFENITILGGLWESTDENLSTLIRLFHGTNITLDGVTCTGGGCVHQVEVAAIDGFYVRNCTFKNYGKKETDVTNHTNQEAIQLDMPCKESVFRGIYPDGTPMKNVEICNNTFKNVARGVGTHTMLLDAYHDNIKINNNKFINVVEECVICLNYTNCEVKDNIIKNCGGGIIVQNFKLSPASINTSTLNGALRVEGNFIHDLNTEISGNKIQIKYTPTSANVSGIYVFGYVLEEDTEGGDGYIIPAGDYYISGIHITDNTITTAGDGIYLRNARNCEVSRNTITGYNYSDNDTKRIYRDGICVSYTSSEITLTNNTIKNVARNGISVLSDSSVTCIVGNTIKNCPQRGIQFFSSTCTDAISDNTISKCSYGGIDVGTRCKTGNIIANVFKSISGLPAIRVFNSSYVQSIESNNIKNMGDDKEDNICSAISISMKSFVGNISGNYIHASKKTYSSLSGISIDHYSRVTGSIADNTIQNSYASAISINDHSLIADLVKNNNINTAKVNGIYLTNYSYILGGMESNDITQCEVSGVVVSKHASITGNISSNSISNCKKNGISIKSISNDIHIINNKLSDNNENGIIVKAAPEYVITIADNTLNGSTCGIKLEKSTISISNNSFSGFAYGIKATKAAAGKIYPNTYDNTVKHSLSVKNVSIDTDMDIQGPNIESNNSVKNINISWDSIENATGYDVEYSSDSSFTSYETRRILGNEDYIVVPNNSGSKKIYIRIRAFYIIERLCVYGIYGENQTQVNHQAG
jgi:parallel beta-helix repeat protein